MTSNAQIVAAIAIAAKVETHEIVSATHRSRYDRGADARLAAVILMHKLGRSDPSIASTMRVTAPSIQQSRHRVAALRDAGRRARIQTLVDHAARLLDAPKCEIPTPAVQAAPPPQQPEPNPAPARAISAAVYVPPWLSKAKRLRKDGWTWKGIAKQVSATPREVAVALGEEAGA